LSRDEQGHATPEPREAARDELIENYRSILNELSLLTTVSVLLFGFLLASPSIASSELEEWVYALTIVLIATATLVFILPVAYHHLQFPYTDFEKFQTRSHNWLRIGLPILGVGFYLSLVLSISSIFNEASIIIAGLPVLATLVFFFTRRG
jgi:hypothetical protein